MRKFLLPVFICLSISFNSKAQYVTVPDSSLLQFLKFRCPGCFNASNMLDTTCSALANVADFWDPGDVTDWYGFQFLRNLHSAHFSWSTTLPPAFPVTLKWLDIQGNGITSIPSLPAALDTLIIGNHSIPVLPILPPTLKYLDCQSSPITSLPSPLPNTLKYINCNGSHLNGLPALPTQLEYLYLYHNNISSLPALPSSLKQLHVYYNNISVLPALPPGLESLDCSLNNISGIFQALPSTLTSFSCSQNQITGLPVLPNSLLDLRCGNNQISVMPDLPPGITYFDCSANLLTVMPSLPNSITTFYCGANQLTSLPPLPSQLLYFGCDNNLLTSLPPLPALLVDFDCQFNQITSMPELPPTLRTFICVSNQLTSLPSLPPGLQGFFCNDNQLDHLPTVPNTVTELSCYHNQFSCLPVFSRVVASEGQMLNMAIDSFINCIPNIPYENYSIVGVIAAGDNPYEYHYPDYNPMPICNPTNNCNHCHSYPLMKGHVYNDLNNNNTRDAGEPFRSNFRIQLSDGSFTLTDNNGYYELMTDTIGSYTVSCTAPVYYSAVPTQYNYNFSTYDTIVTGDFALQLTTIVDSLAISITPLEPFVRINSPLTYLVNYVNIGSTTLSPNIVFNYDNTRLNYDSSSNAAVINNGTSLQLIQPNMNAGDQNSFEAYFTVKLTAVIGDTITAHATIAAGTATDADSALTVIRGAYDPNDKSATPLLTPGQLNNGDYINYVIRFQNVGTDTAFDVVVADTLSSYLQPATLEMNHASHICKTTVKNNIVYFEFINILLPDSNVNEAKSHGFASFRVKPRADVNVNTNIPNKASIYFDFNSAVVTNTAVTTIGDQIIVPLKLLSFTATRQTKNTAIVYWNTANEINVSKFIIESSTDGRNFSGIATENAKAGTFNNYSRTIAIAANEIIYLRLKMMDIDGRVSYSTVVILRWDNSNTAFTFLDNPVKDVLSIAVNDASLKNTQASIISVSGTVIQTFIFKNDTEYINTRQLSPGTYILKTIKGSRQFIVVK